jgi:tryptophan halogenase
LLKPRKVLIVGGGIAGWMTATHLHAALNRDGRRVCDVGLIETRDADAPTTAEATLPEINRYLSILGVDQPGFMRQAGATFSQGTRFVDWLDGGGEYFYHPFGIERPGSIDRAAQRWLRSNRSIPFADTVSVQPALCEANLAPLMLARWDFGPPLPYGFHVDAGKFTAFLKALATSGPVAYSADPAVGVDVTADGTVSAVVTAAGQRVEADLYVDCSGAEGFLVERLGVGWVDRSQSLLCDSLLSMNVAWERHYPGYVRPYTQATGLSAGWLQDMPLQDRRSLRYFYASAFQTDDDAARELREFEGPHAASLDIEDGRQRTGHREQAWVGNCIAIGGAANAIEPLASTNLYLVDHAAAMLVEHFPLGDELEPLAFRFNRIMANRFYEILDFVNLHYCLTRRDDSEFWREARQPSRITDRLKAKLDFWQSKQPTPADFEDQDFPAQGREPLPHSRPFGDYRSPIDTGTLWDHESYQAVLYGMDFLGPECDARFGAERPDPVVPPHIAARIAQAPQKLPPHALWLRQALGMPDYPPR